MYKSRPTTVSSYKWLEKPVKGLLLDINGVLKDSDSAICGSLLGFETLQKLGIPYRLLTNETTQTNKNLAYSLKKLGFKITEKDIISPIPVLIKILQQNFLRPHLLVHNEVMEEFLHVDVDEQNCVVIGDAGPNFSYHNLNQAFRILYDMPEPRLFSLGNRKYYKGKHGLTLDVGTFTNALEFSTGVKATVIGKPSTDYFNFAIKEMGLNPEDVVMLGDDLELDVQGAQACGIRGVLVKSRKIGDYDMEIAAQTADGVVRNLYEATQLISYYSSKV